MERQCDVWDDGHAPKDGAGDSRRLIHSSPGARPLGASGLEKEVGRCLVDRQNCWQEVHANRKAY